MNPRARHRLVRLAAVLGAWLGVSLPALASGDAPSPFAQSESFEHLMLRAEEERALGHHAASAGLFADAYRARAPGERADPVGEIVVRNAMTEYARAAESGETLGLLRAQAQLLGEFLDARREQRAAAEVANDAELPEVPSDLVDERERLVARIEQLQEDEPEAMPTTTTEAPRQPSESAPEARRKGGDIALLAIGGASLVGGVVLSIDGLWTLHQVQARGDARRTALAAEPGYNTNQRSAYLVELSAWERRWRGTATGLVVTGAVLTAAGIGLTTWGAIRLRRHRAAGESRIGVVPSLAPRMLGLRISTTF